MKKIKEMFYDFKLLLRNIPSLVVALFTASVIAMNLMANKTIISFENESIGQWFALDGGFLVSWISFMCMDIITKRFGPKSATKISIVALLINLFTCLLFWIVSIIPDVPTQDATAVNEILGGSWFILLSSSVAFIVSAFVNNFLNFAIGKMFKKNPDGKLAYVTRTYISTFIGQFIDNLIFAVLTFMLFAPIYWNFEWSFLACITCAVTGGLFELLMEVIFSPLGYHICNKWEQEKIGQQYLDYVASKSNNKNEEVIK